MLSLRSRLGVLVAIVVLGAVFVATPADAGHHKSDAEPMDVQDARQIWRGSVLNGANGLYVGPDGNIYTGSVFGNEIVVQNPRNGAVLDRISRERSVNGPDDIFITDDGTIYWTDILGGTVGMLKPNGEQKTQFVALGVNPITMSDDGRLFVNLVFLGDGMYELDPNLEQPPELVFSDPTPIIGMNGMDFGPDGLLYGPIFFGGAVARLDVLNRTPGVDPTVEVVADGFRTPSAVKFNSKGELFVSDLAEGQILKVVPLTGEREVIVDIEGIIDNLAFNARDRLFFAADADGQLMTVTPSGKARALNRSGFTSPSTIAQTDDGTIWVADGGELRGFGNRRNPTSSIYFRFDPPFAGMAGANTVASDGDLLITVGGLTQAVQVLDPSDGTIIEDIRTIPAPVNAIAHDGGLAVASLAVGVVDGDGVPIGGPWAYPLGLASDGTTLYVSDWILGTVTAVTGAVSVTVATGLLNPEGLALDGDRLLVVEEGRDQVSAIDLGTGEVTTLITGLDLGPDIPTSPFVAPHGTINGVTIASDGSMYVSQDGADNAVFKFRPRRH